MFLVLFFSTLVATIYKMAVALILTITEETVDSLELSVVGSYNKLFSAEVISQIANLRDRKN